ncbi:hypothetical protein HO133_004465 [Letharia lupina]|uniref:Uncharacterized protein n=1 Tax=Letharia lupina TaxID=560253 RepID=A0A8H6FKB2_9LECA|nr:uncharacterized protein HO133_004465 [Letharia lupina]KAF6230126.1 hypothetical protein HO133_004465 [Letharia lupina]
MSSISPISPLSPISPMSPAKSSTRPTHLLLNQHSSSLSGMEIAVPSPLTPGFTYSRASSSKALPPTPRKDAIPYSPHSAPTSRKASSTYSNSKEERPSTSMTLRKPSTTYTNLKEERPRTPRFALQDEALSSKTFLAPSETRSSTSKLPDKVPLRPQLTRDAHTHGASDFTGRKQPSGNSFFTEWKAPKYEYSDDEFSSSLPASRRDSSQGSWAPSERTQSAEERARDYTSVLPAFVPEPVYSESGYLPSEMSARITDVLDGSLMPAPLILSGNSEDRKLSSQFSCSDSEVDSLHDESKPSLKSRAKKAFHSRTQERREKAHTDLQLPQHGQAGELTTAKRASLQNGIDEMYNTLTGLYSPAKSKMKHDSDNFKSKAIARDPRHPATRVKAYQESGKRAWDSPRSPKSPAPKRDDSVGKKLASVFQNGAMAVGFERGKEQKMKNEE